MLVRDAQGWPRANSGSTARSCVDSSTSNSPTSNRSVAAIPRTLHSRTVGPRWSRLRMRGPATGALCVLSVRVPGGWPECLTPGLGCLLSCVRLASGQAGHRGPGAGDRYSVRVLLSLASRFEPAFPLVRRSAVPVSAGQRHGHPGGRPPAPGSASRRNAGMPFCTGSQAHNRNIVPL